MTGATEPSWRAHADRLAELALSRLILPDTGALPEFFDGDWRPLPDARGLQIEPGHQFEWSWLLLEWLGARRDAKAFAAAVRLAEIGETHGICPDRGVAFGAIDEHLRQRDAEAKLWPQTERLKVWHVLAGHPLAGAEDRLASTRRRRQAEAGLMRYLERSPPGIWHEIMAGGRHLPRRTRAGEQPLPSHAGRRDGGGACDRRQAEAPASARVRRRPLER